MNTDTSFHLFWASSIKTHFTKLQRVPHLVYNCTSSNKCLSYTSSLHDHGNLDAMQTPKCRTKSVHISEVSTVVKRTWKTQWALIKVSTRAGCPHKWGVHRARFHCTALRCTGNALQFGLGGPPFFIIHFTFTLSEQATP